MLVWNLIAFHGVDRRIIQRDHGVLQWQRERLPHRRLRAKSRGLIYAMGAGVTMIHRMLPSGRNLSAARQAGDRLHSAQTMPRRRELRQAF